MVNNEKTTNDGKEKMNVDVMKVPVKKGLSIDLNKIVNSVKDSFGKDKSAASKISTGASISRPSKDSDFILWAGVDGNKSYWEILTGTRGLPFGFICQISGKSNSGKSTHAMKFIKLAQEQNVLVILIDSENKFSKERFLKYFKGDPNNILITTSKMILEAASHVEKYLHAIYEQNPDQKVLIVWDSIGGSLPKNEGEDSLDASKQMAAASKENGAALRAFIRLMEKYKDKEKNEEKIACLLINQTYASLSSPGQIQAGGAKVEYYSSLILQLTRCGDLTKTKDGLKYKTGIETRSKASKNHLASEEETIAEIRIAVTAGDIKLMSEKKVKAVKTIKNSETGEMESEIEEDVEE